MGPQCLDLIPVNTAGILVQISISVAQIVRSVLHVGELGRNIGDRMTKRFILCYACNDYLGSHMDLTKYWVLHHLSSYDLDYITEWLDNSKVGDFLEISDQYIVVRTHDS